MLPELNAKLNAASNAGRICVINWTRCGRKEGKKEGRKERRKVAIY
jgi:hypothetical protein